MTMIMDRAEAFGQVDELPFGVHKYGEPGPVLADREACACAVPIGCLFEEHSAGGQAFVAECICDRCFRACVECAAAYRMWAEARADAWDDTLRGL